MVEIYKYSGIQSSVYANARRHMARAKMHLEAGRADYAAGSLRKAARNFERAYHLEHLFDVEVKGPLAQVVSGRIKEVMHPMELNLAAEIFGSSSNGPN